MEIFAHLSVPLDQVARQAQVLEDVGVDGAMTSETAHDPFFPLLIAAQNTQRLKLMTGIAVGFARTPMLLAGIAHDLNSFSSGRFTLGIGSQIKAHIERRFSMPWSKPAARMREMVQAIKTIQGAWHDGEKLRFEGEHYTHTLMTPMFAPTDTEAGKPPIYVAAVGPLMTQVAGEVADGMLVHSFSTDRFIREVTIPNVTQGARLSGRTLSNVKLNYGPFIITGESDEEMERSRESAAGQLAFYASTPAYRPVLDLHGWGDLQPELLKMTKEGRWNEMSGFVTDEMLDAFAVVGPPASIAGQIVTRYAELVDEIVIWGDELSASTLAQIVSDLREAGHGGRPAGTN
jgi:probable F420-dependent oxidoreductase